MLGYGIVVLIVGVMIFTIGGLVDLAGNYQRYEDEIRDKLRALRRNPWRRQTVGVDFSNPKARPFLIVGMAVIIVGFGIMICGSQGFDALD